VVTRTPRLALAALAAIAVTLAGVAAASGSTGKPKVNASVKVDTTSILLNGGYWWIIRADGKPER
jgi:hypothetical protein